MRYLSILSLAAFIIITACKKDTAAVNSGENAAPACKDTTKAGGELKMYEMSEMAALMEQMYAENQMLKQRIVAGDTIGRFPQRFLEIHASTMTDESENDAFFKEQAAKFITAQELIYKDSLNAKAHFNDAVSACVKCHEQKCGGPIPRIKKLYIK